MKAVTLRSGKALQFDKGGELVTDKVKEVELVKEKVAESKDEIP